MALLRAFAVSLVLCLPLLLAGCGSSGSSMTTPATQPAPQVSSLSPSSAVAGSAGMMLTVSGSNFVPGSEITWQGTEVATLYVSSTSLQTTIPTSSLTSAAIVQVGVENPSGEGGTSASTVPFTISADNSPNPAPVLTSITPTTAQTGASSVVLTLTGSGFIPTSTVLLNGSLTIPTVYQSATSLTATIPALNLESAGTLTVSVENPTPGGGTSEAQTLTVGQPSSANGVTIIDAEANDLAWDPVNQVIYLSLPSAAGSNGNAVQVLNPATGVLGANAFAGSEPDLLAVSKSSKYLYVALDGSSSLQRFNLPELTTDINISFGPASFYGPYVAMDVEPSPVADGTVAFVLGTPGVSPEEEGGVHIYDDSTARPNALCGFIQIGCTGETGGDLFDSIQWNPAASEMYMLNNEDTGFDFYEAPVTASGFGTVTDYGALAGGFGDMLHYDNTTNLLYTDYGVVIDPTTGTKTGQIDASGLAVPAGQNGLIFYLGQTSSDLSSGSYTIESFDINRLTPVGSLTIPNVVGTPAHFISWGTSGLAFTTVSSTGSTTPGAVYLISSSFVTTNSESSEAPAENVHRTWSSKRSTKDARPVK
jgi:hypothetical protein